MACSDTTTYPPTGVQRCSRDPSHSSPSGVGWVHECPHAPFAGGRCITHSTFKPSRSIFQARPRHITEIWKIRSCSFGYFAAFAATAVPSLPHWVAWAAPPAHASLTNLPPMAAERLRLVTGVFWKIDGICLGFSGRVGEYPPSAGTIVWMDIFRMHGEGDEFGTVNTVQ